ncbi:MAG: hypothetical protein Q9204_005821, partial [Flavoplaca sp. TL-2023a]
PQFSRIGSFARIPSWGGILLERADSVSISFWCQPTLPRGAKHNQFLFSSTDNSQLTGFECFLNQAGVLRLRTGVPNGMQEVILSVNLLRYQWYHLVFSMRSSSGTLTLKSKAKARDIGEPEELLEETHSLEQPLRIASHVPLTIGSDSHGCRTSTKPIDSGSFNGKIERFRIETRSSAGHIDTLLDLDFSLDIPTDKVRDVSGNEHHGELINGPSRAVTGHDWHASQTDWTHASYGYGAIYFHDDDLDDAQWETTFELDVPKDLHSGYYDILIDDRVEVHFPGDPDKKDKYFQTLMKRPDLGISLYDSHNDGSGTIFSSLKRPVLNMRPDYSMWLFDGPRELSADLWFVEFLDRELGPEGYDVITDHDISEQGAPLLKSHPEYPTYRMLDAYAAFLANGGHFMYLGGNGYYWVTSHDPGRPHRIEVRRAEAGCRTFGLPPGNWHHSLSGELGGLWRSRGRPPNKLFGVGSCAMGVGKGAGYGITDEARSKRHLSFIFRGIESDTTIGDFGLVQGAASGDEIDRMDYGLGTPKNAVMIATTKLAGGHSDEYMLFNEETLYPMVNLHGTASDKIRSDIVYFETPSEGAVFSVGSINWVGALAWKSFDNNIARISSNVLHEFVRRSK